MLIWITGLSGSGKSTIGKALYSKLKVDMPNLVFLDGDDFREILGNDLGHSPNDRLNNAKRISKMCKFLNSQKINVICSTMSLYKEIHEMNRKNIQEYYEIFIECSIDELIKRDQKGIYSKALRGEIKNVVGIDLSYDRPDDCHLCIENEKQSDLDKKVEQIIKLIGE